MPALGFRVAMSRGASFVAGFQGSCTWYNMFSKFCWLIRVGGTYVCILYFVTVAFVFDSFLSLSLSLSGAGRCHGLVSLVGQGFVDLGVKSRDAFKTEMP